MLGPDRSSHTRLRELWCSTAAEDVYARGLKHLEEHRLEVAIADFAEAASLGSAGGNFHLALAYDGLLGRDARDQYPIEPDPAAGVAPAATTRCR